MVAALKSDEIKDFINEKYDGAVIPFDDSTEDAAAEDTADAADTEEAADADTDAAADTEAAEDTAE